MRTKYTRPLARAWVVRTRLVVVVKRSTAWIKNGLSEGRSLGVPLKTAWIRPLPTGSVETVRLAVPSVPSGAVPRICRPRVKLTSVEEMLAALGR